MLRTLALLATVAIAGTLSGGANAHPPDISVLYGSQSHAPHGYAQPGQGNTYGLSSYSAPLGSGAYGTQSYSRPAYDAAPLYSRTYGTPRYRAPSYRAPAYRAPAYRAPAYNSPIYDQPTYSTTPVSSYSGYTNPGYGYRPRRGQSYVHPRNLRIERPLPPTRHRSFGPYSRVPSSEGVNYGYSGGPTYGSDASPVINGVLVNRNQN